MIAAKDTVSIHFFLRRLKRQPVFSLAVVCSFAVSFAAATAILAILYATAVKSFPYPVPEQLVVISSKYRQDPDYVDHLPLYLVPGFAAERRLFSQCIALRFGDRATLRWAGIIERIREGMATPGLLRMLGAVPADQARFSSW